MVNQATQNQIIYLQESIQQVLFLGLRSPRKRSLLGVNEHFKGKRNAEIALFELSITSPPRTLRPLAVPVHHPVRLHQHLAAELRPAPAVPAAQHRDPVKLPAKQS